MPSDAENEGDRFYATVSHTHRLASLVNHGAHNILSESSNSAAASTTVTDIPQSSLKPNIAYGRIERKMVNGIGAPMRPPQRPPH